MLSVQFAPGARTDWHSHAEGQVLYVLSANGVVNESGVAVALSPGDALTAPAAKAALAWRPARLAHVAFVGHNRWRSHLE